VRRPIAPERIEEYALSQDIGLLLLRLSAGGMMAFGHGLGKVSKILTGSFEFADPLGIGPAISLVLAALAEFVCSVLVVLGVKTRLVAAPVVFTMLVAAFVVHAGDPWAKKEMALLYALAFGVLLCTGAGRFGFDGMGRKRKRT